MTQVTVSRRGRGDKGTGSGKEEAGPQYPGAMTDDSAWLSVPDFAEQLGTTASKVREMVREGELLSVRRGERQTVQIPAGFIVDGEEGPTVLPTLRGTLTLLRDAGFGDGEAADWLMSDEPELGMSPLAALREGRRAHVRRIAQAML
ncbi:hypothetical protein GCM10025873_06370 [Demequina sediminis]|nr:hypothetical protein GCM10025873_06370 [Demequina sediminis]